MVASHVQRAAARLAVIGLALASAPLAHADDGDTAPPAPRWPSAVFDRPLTLPAGLVLAGGDVNAVTIPGTATAGTTLGQVADVALGVGLTDELELNTLAPTFTIPVHPDGSLKGALDVGLGAKVLRGALGGKLEVIARAVGGYDLAASAARPLRLGLHAQYNVTSRIALLSHDIGVGNAGLVVGLTSPHPVELTVPVGVAYQAAPALWLEVDTAVATVALSHATTSTIADATPVFATAIYNTAGGHLDVLGYLGVGDAQHAGDTLTFGVGVRYYAGSTD